MTKIVHIKFHDHPVLGDLELDFRGPDGFVPHIQTALGLETPSPLDIRIDKGEADITVVLKDILALTKLNYNACQYGDGLPVTLRFADSVGNILTASAKQVANPPLAFKYYI